METIKKIVSALVIIQAIHSLAQLQYDALSALDYGVLISSVLALIVITLYGWRSWHDGKNQESE